MKTIDVKSLIIGILGTVLVFVLMGHTSVKKSYEVECVYSPKFNSEIGIACSGFPFLSRDSFDLRILGTLYVKKWVSAGQRK